MNGHIEMTNLLLPSSCNRYFKHGDTKSIDLVEVVRIAIVSEIATSLPFTSAQECIIRSVQPLGTSS